MHYRLTILTLILCAFPSFAEQDEIARLIETTTAAKPIERVPPRYPVLAAKQGQEGWVKMSFVIDKQGNVVEPIVEDSSGIKRFENEAIRAIKKWKYDPAQQDGKNIEQCKTTVQLDFRLRRKNEKGGGVTKKFYRKYNEIFATIEQKDYPKAEQLLIALLEKKLWNMYENDWYWLADSLYANAINNPERELASVSRAIKGGKNTLGKDNYIYVLQRKFILQVQHQLYAGALDTFQRIRKVKGTEQIIEKYEPVETQIIATIASEKPMIRNAHIGERGHVYHKLSRNRFQLNDVQGPLKELEIRCDNHRSRFTAAEESIWKIPANWGKCTVFFKGEENTKFDIIELANQA